ncbi:MAG: tetratricopeptide repeat protein [Bacteroidota bacterium]
MKKFTSSFLYIICFLVLSGCVTKKKKQDVGPIGKGYHNMTARYNGYYNASNLLLESQIELEDQHKDNYNQILPIYKYMAADNPKAVAEPLDEAIVKVTTVVALHEPARWVDDCYLLAGQAQFLKQDYETAEETFEYLIAEYSPQKMAERASVSKARAKRSKAVKESIKKGERPTVDETGEKVQLTKKEREKLAKNKKRENKKKRKARERERKLKKKEIQRKRKGKSTSQKRKPDPKKKDRQEEEDTKLTENLPKEEVDDLPRLPNGYPMPGSVRLSNLEMKIEDGDPENYTFKHRPAYQEGILWLARTYIERESYNYADRLLMRLENNSATPKDIRREADIARAHFYLKQKKYSQATEPLQNAINSTKDNLVRARLNFILGQLHSRANQGNAAYAAFEEVIKNKPAFEMDFNARLNLALAGVNSEADSRKKLERMLKEEKNLEFSDQIYYALADLDLQKGDKPGAIANLEKCLEVGSTNRALRAEAFLKLADLYFEDEQYVEAKSNYDATLGALNKKDERYERVERLSKSLTGIAENIQIITLQDSLLRISGMTVEEKRELAQAMKKAQEEKRLEAIRKEAEKRAAAPARSSVRTASNQSDFWAYDDRDVKKGIREFQRQWGSRTLTDNWRLSNQASFGGVEITQAKEKGGPLTDEEINEIFKDVPESEDEIAASNRMIEAAMFTLGTHYRDRLKKYDKCIETMLELLNRYPDTQYKLDAYYYLHLAYQDKGDITNAQIYYDKIVNGYPNTNYARMLKDPNFALQVNSKEAQVTKYYDETYAIFEKRDFQNALNRISKVGEKFGGTNPLMPRFSLLQAMCVGNIEGKERYVEELKAVIAKHPEEPEASTAREMLRNLGQRVNTGPGQQRNLPNGEGQVGNYKVEESQLHYVIVVFKNKVSLNDAKVGVSDYNKKYHSQDKLRMNNIYLGTGKDRYPIVAIRRFKDKTDAMDYYDGVQKNKKDFLDKKTFDYELLAIGQSNYRELLKSKNLVDYRTFFDLNYLN